MAGLVKDISDAEFEQEVLKNALPTLVDFWATWCAPCRAIAPVVEDLAKTYQGKVNFVKVNIDDNQNTPTQYGVRGIPTLLLFKNGEVFDQVVGNVPKDNLVTLIDKSLS